MRILIHETWTQLLLENVVFSIFKMDFFDVLLFALGLASVTCANLLEESHFNPQESCENFHYGGMRLKIADVIVGDKIFDWKNCGEVVPIDDVNKEIPIVKFSQVHLQMP